MFKFICHHVARPIGQDPRRSSHDNRKQIGNPWVGSVVPSAVRTTSVEEGTNSTMYCTHSHLQFTFTRLWTRVVFTG